MSFGCCYRCVPQPSWCEAIIQAVAQVPLGSGLCGTAGAFPTPSRGFDTGWSPTNAQIKSMAQKFTSHSTTWRALDESSTTHYWTTKWRHTQDRWDAGFGDGGPPCVFVDNGITTRWIEEETTHDYRDGAVISRIKRNHNGTVYSWTLNTDGTITETGTDAHDYDWPTLGAGRSWVDIGQSPDTYNYNAADVTSATATITQAVTIQDCDGNDVTSPSMTEKVEYTLSNARTEAAQWTLAASILDSISLSDSFVFNRGTAGDKTKVTAYTAATVHEHASESSANWLFMYSRNADLGQSIFEVSNSNLYNTTGQGYINNGSSITMSGGNGPIAGRFNRINQLGGFNHDWCGWMKSRMRINQSYTYGSPPTSPTFQVCTEDREVPGGLKDAHCDDVNKTSVTWTPNRVGCCPNTLTEISFARTESSYTYGVVFVHVKCGASIDANCT